MMLLLFWTCGLICAAFAAPVEVEIPFDPMEDPDLFGGDMVGVITDDRNVIPKEKYRWPGATVAYVIDPSLTEHKDVILQGMKNYEDNTCVRFVPRTTEKNYVKLFRGQVCNSPIGMRGGVQILNLANGCHTVGQVVHELGHALGVYHEQNRSDRDEYLEIFLENVMKEKEVNFMKLRPDQNLLLTPFNYNSIMIYAGTHFSKDKKSITMRARDGTPLVKPALKDGMDEIDIKRINLMYNCQEVTDE